MGAALVALGAMQGPDGEVEVVEEEVAVDIPDGDDGDYDDQGYDDDDGVERKVDDDGGDGGNSSTTITVT